MLWYIDDITLSVSLILKIFRGKPLNPTYQQNSQGEVCTLTLPRYVSYMQGAHIYKCPGLVLAGLSKTELQCKNSENSYISFQYYCSLSPFRSSAPQATLDMEKNPASMKSKRVQWIVTMNESPLVIITIYWIAKKIYWSRKKLTCM